MANEYISRDEAIKAAFSLCHNTDYPFIDEIQNAIEEIPSADVRPVVTCEECVFHVDNGTHFCNKWCEPCPDNAEFFCAYGERDNCGTDMRKVVEIDQVKEEQ